MALVASIDFYLNGMWAHLLYLVNTTRSCKSHECKAEMFAFVGLLDCAFLEEENNVDKKKY